MAWLTETQITPPKNLLEADDRLSVQDFIAKVSQGAAFLWKGDFHNAKNLLAAVDRRLSKTKSEKPAAANLKDVFNLQRQAQAHRARTLSRLWVRVEADLSINLPRAPDLREALGAALENPVSEPFEISLRELLGMIGAYEWRKRGVLVPALGANIHPHYGVFAPIRGEYLELLVKAPLSDRFKSAIDVGTGTGVIAALLAKRGVAKIVATDTDARALKCADENLRRLGLIDKVDLQKCDLFPQGRADLIVCNPPWLPARPTSRLENAVYDYDGRMLKGFLSGVSQHLNEGGEVWLIISDLAERIGLRAPDELAQLFAEAKLRVIEKIDIRPSHKKTANAEDPLHEARSQEITSLWRLQL